MAISLFFLQFCKNELFLLYVAIAWDLELMVSLMDVLRLL